MNSPNKFAKHVAAVFALLVLFQSCTIYKPLSLDEALNADSKHIKVRTFNGEKYQFSWLEYSDGDLVTIRNINRYFIEKDRIQYVLRHDASVKISIDTVIKYKQPVRITTNNAYGIDKTYDFIQIRDLGNVVAGYEMVNMDTSRVAIPVTEIEQVQVVDQPATTYSRIYLATTIILLALSTSVDAETVYWWW